MSVRLGLTGSIGMGKSTTAQMFRDLGVPVWDADEAVHRMYAPGGAAVAPVAEILPDAIDGGAVRRERLKEAMKTDPSLLGRIESVVHPLVAADRAEFVAAHRDSPLIVLDIPLLFETGAEATVDAVLVVTTDPETQKDRVMARPGMTEALFDQIRARQVPDAEKRARADHVIETNTLEDTRASVAELVKTLTGGRGKDA
jgi:dephospho-CoA kinase